MSSFGIGGTNAHVVLEEAPAPTLASPDGSPQLLTLSARTPAALDELRRRLATYLTEHPRLDLSDVAYTLQCGRKSLPHRSGLVCRGIEDAVEALTGLDTQRIFTGPRLAGGRPVAFLFPGQGTQYVNMARGLYDNEPTFREQVDIGAKIIEPILGTDLRGLLYPCSDTLEEAKARLQQTSVAQPALFLVEYALARLWMKWGLFPEAMLGHSIGEYVAACLAGVMSLEDALTLVAERGRLMQIPGGGMLAVALDGDRIAADLTAGLSIAAYNAPSLCVVSGPDAELTAFQQRLALAGVQSQRLHTAHAFHSGMMDAALSPFGKAVARLSLRAPQIPYLSNVTGTWITEQEAMDPAYWVRHLRETVRFSRGLTHLLDDPNRILLEVGPGDSLATITRQHRAGGYTIVSSLRHPRHQGPDTEVLLGALGRLWTAGASVDWGGVNEGRLRRRVALPTYPFERQRYWVTPKPSARAEP